MQPAHPGAARFALIVTALSLAVVAQVLIGAGSLRWAVAPLVVSIGAAAWAASRMPLPSDAPPRDAGQRPPAPAPRRQDDHGLSERFFSRERIAGLVGLGIGVFLLVLALFEFTADSPYTVAWFLYAASMVVLLLALPTFESRWSHLARRFRRQPLVQVDLRTLLPWAALAAVLVLALLLRLHRLEELPAGLWYDEADNLVHARQIQNDPGSTPVFVPSTNLPSLFLLPIAVVVEVAGVTITSGRLVSVAFGLAGIVAVFLLARFALGPAMAVLAAFLVAVMRWDINWSRIGMHGITAPLFAALAVFLTLRALRSGRISDFGYAGVVLGLGMWFYASLRLFPLVIGFMLIHHLVLQRPAWKRFAVQVLVMAVVALMVAAPVVQSSVLEPDEFFSRAEETSVFAHAPLGDAFADMWDSLGKHALMFTYEGDPNPRHNLPDEPMLDFMSGILLLLGVGIALARWRNVALASLPLWLLIMVLPGVITLPWEAPQSLRSIAVTPAVALAVAMTLGVAWWAGRSSPWRAVRNGTPAVLVAVLGGVAFLNVDTYFGEQARNPEVYRSFSTDETLMARHMVEQQRRGHSLFVSRQFIHSLTASLLAADPLREVIRAPVDIPIDPAKVWLGASIYLEPRESSVYRLLQTYYPDGTYEEVRPPGGGEPLYYSAVIAREQLEARQGLSALYTFADGETRESIQQTTEGVWPRDIGPGEAPFDVVWRGALHVTIPGEYVLELVGDVAAEVMLDGTRILTSGRPSAHVVPAVGLHSLEVRAHVGASKDFLRVLWQIPGGELAPIGLGHLYHGTVRPVGLAGRFYSEGTESGTASAMRVTPAVDIFYYEPVIDEPYFAVWDGTLDVPARGEYRFGVSGAGEMKLFVDGDLVAARPTFEGRGPVGSAQLYARRHRARVEYQSKAPPSQFEVLWAPPGSVLGPIPIDRLAPDPTHMLRVLDSGR